MNNDYNSMSLVELKQVAKEHRIKMYYTKKRVELIRLLSLPTLPDSYKIEKMTIVELRQQAKDRGMRGFWGLSRDELVTLLYPNGELGNEVDKNDKDSNNSEEHKTPKSYNSE